MGWVAAAEQAMMPNHANDAATVATVLDAMAGGATTPANSDENGSLNTNLVQGRCPAQEAPDGAERSTKNCRCCRPKRLVAAAKWIYRCGTSPGTYHLLAIIATNRILVLRF